MKKKILSLLLVLSLVFSSLMVTQAASNLGTDDLVRKSGSDALTALKAGKANIIDVRSKENQAKGTVDGAISLPLFGNTGESTFPTALADDFKDEIKAKKSSWSSKDIYIICNSGMRGAQNATNYLIDAGYSASKIFTVKDGAKSLEIRYAFLRTDGNPVSGGTALTADKDKTVIVDLRTEAVRGSKGILKDSVWIPVFGSSGAAQTAEDETAKTFFAKLEENKAALNGKEIYLLCNSGQSGARAATVLLKDKGYDLDKIHTITGGATKSLEIRYALLNKIGAAVTGKEALAADSSKAVILDLRADSKRATDGILPGAVIAPVFGASGPAELTDDAIAEVFKAAIEKNADKLKDKEIYLLCNSGARGARAASILLIDAKYDAEKIHTITNGATDDNIKAAFVVDKKDETPSDTTKEKVTVKLVKSSFTYNKKLHKPLVSVRDGNGKKVSSKNYTIYRKSHSLVGKYQVTVTFKNELKGLEKVKLTWQVKPKSTKLAKKPAAARRAFTAKWNKQSKQTSGYQVQYATNKKFTKNDKIKTIKGTKATSTTVKKLKAKTTYYVRVRTYKNVKFGGKTVKVFSNWSNYRTVKTK